REDRLEAGSHLLNPFRVERVSGSSASCTGGHRVFYVVLGDHRDPRPGSWEGDVRAEGHQHGGRSGHVLVDPSAAFLAAAGPVLELEDLAPRDPAAAALAPHRHISALEKEGPVQPSAAGRGIAPEVVATHHCSCWAVLQGG